MKAFYAAIAAILIAFPAFALDLQSLRASGQVGEKNDGYIAVLSGGNDVSKFVDEVNGKRRAEYTRISKENGQSVGVVAKLAAEQIINGLPTGAMYQDGNGTWKKR